MVALAPGYGDTGMTVKIVFLVFTAVIYQQIFLFSYQGQDIVLGEFKMGGQLDGQGRAGLLAKAAVDAAGEIDPEPGGEAPAVFPFGGLHGDTTDRTDGRAQITGHTTLLAVRVPGKDDSGPGTAGQGPFILRILFGHRLSEQMLQNGPKAPGQSRQGIGPNAFKFPGRPIHHAILAD